MWRSADSGDLLYRFDRRLIARDAVPLGTRLRRAAWSAFKTGFKVMTAVVLVVYVLVFVAILVALIFARQGDRDGGFGGRGGGFGLGDFLLIHWLMGGRGWRRGSLYYGDAHARRLPKDARPPFYKKVFAFMFGPEEPRPTQLQKDRSVVQLIRARSGLVTAPELVEHTALPLHEAEEEMGRLIGAYGGDPQVSDRGELVYAFPGLMKSAHGRVRAREPRPAWMRLERPRLVTGNSTGANVGIGLLYAFNLVCASALVLLPAFEAARLGLPPVPPLMFVGLGVIPAGYSAVALSIPLIRRIGVGRENRARVRRNIRRLLLGLVYSRSLAGNRWVSVQDAVRHVGRTVKDQPSLPSLVQKELERLAGEFDADVEAGPESGGPRDSEMRYRFGSVRQSFVEAEVVRRRLRLGDQKLGPIVYDTSDTADEESEREMKALERELGLDRYLPSPDRVDYQEDFEVVMSAAERTPVRVGRSTRGRPQGRSARRPGRPRY